MKAVVKTFSTYFLFDAINKALPFLLLPIIAHYLTTEEFGIVSNYLAFYQVVLIVIAYSTYTKLSTAYFENENHLAPLYSNLYYVMVLFFGISMLLIFLFHRIIDKYMAVGLQWQIIAVVTALCASLVQLYTTLLMMQKKSLKYGLVQNIQSLLLFGFTLLLVAVIPLGWKGRIWGQFISYLGVCIVVVSWCKKKEKLVFSKIDKRLILSIIIWGAPLLPHTLSYWIKGGVDKIVVTNAVGLSMNGIYSLALTLGSIMSLISTSFFNVYSPFCYKKLHEYDHKEDSREKQGIINTILKYNSLFVLAFGVISIVAYYALKFFIPFFFSDDYVAAVEFLPLVLLMNWIYTIYTVNSCFLFYRNKTKTIGVITISSSIGQVLLNIVLVKIWGVYGVLISGVAIAVIISLLISFFAFQVYHISLSK